MKLLIYGVFCYFATVGFSNSFSLVKPHSINGSESLLAEKRYNSEPNVVWKIFGKDEKIGLIETGSNKNLLDGSRYSVVVDAGKSSIYKTKVILSPASKSNRSTEVPNNTTYNDIFARQKFFPMAAAAYSDQPEICLNNTFLDATLYRTVNITCDTHGKNDICAGFTAVSHNDSAIILSFRGTNSFTQLLLESGDTTFESMVNSPIGGKVGAYFMDVFEKLWVNNTMSFDILSLAKQYPDYELWITGHSLGGALATLAAVHILADNRYPKNIKLFTLGQPRTGNKDFAQAVNDLFPPNSTYRITHSRDPVVHLPPHSYKNYTHNIAEVWYYNDMTENATYTAVCAGDGESRNCSGNIHYVFSVMDHIKYFGTSVSEFGIGGCVKKEDNDKKKKKKKKRARIKYFNNKIPDITALRILHVKEENHFIV